MDTHAPARGTEAPPLPASSRGVAGLLSFDAGIVLAAALLPALVGPRALIEALSSSGVATICALVAAMLPYSLIRQHESVVGAGASPGYTRAVALAIRLVGFVLVLGGTFVIPMNLAHAGLAPGHLDGALFVVMLIAMLGGVLAGFGNRGAGLALALGAALLGLFFSLPGDVSRWLDGRGLGPWPGIGAAAAAVALVVFVGRFVGRLDELSAALDALLARPSGAFAGRIALPFLSAVALSLWSVIYAELVVSRVSPALAIPCLVALGVAPYRVLLILSPPLRPVPILTGIASLGAWLATTLP